MARAGWYYENAYRDYPFLDQLTPLQLVIGDVTDDSSSSLSSSSSSSSSVSIQLKSLPEEAIVDFGTIMGIDAKFNDDKHWVHLYRITRTDPYFVYEFRTNAPGAIAESLVFVRDTGIDGENTIEWVTSRAIGLPDPIPGVSSSSLSSSSSSSSSSAVPPYPFCEQTSLGSEALDCGGDGCSPAAWEGFMVTGLYDDLTNQLADNETVIFDRRNWVIEPGRIQNLSKSFVQSVNLANSDRTHVTLPAACSSSDGAAETELYFVNAECLQGNVRFKEGFNCSIRQETNNNSIVINGNVGGGAGEACDEVPLYTGEEPPAGSVYLSGGPTCGEIVKAINGKSGRNLRIDAGPGFRIGVDPGDPSTLIINATLDDFALCLDSGVESSDSC